MHRSILLTLALLACGAPNQQRQSDPLKPTETPAKTDGIATTQDQKPQAALADKSFERVACDAKSFTLSALGEAAPIPEIDEWDPAKVRAGGDKEHPIERCGNRDAYYYVSSVFRCPDGKNPLGGDVGMGGRSRRGNVGPNHTGHIIDVYQVPCSGGSKDVFVDSYGCPSANEMFARLLGKAKPAVEIDRRPVPSQAVELYNSAAELHKNGDHAAALTLVQEAVASLVAELGQKHPGLGETLFLMSVIQLSLKDESGAEATLVRGYKMWADSGWPAVRKAADTVRVLAHRYKDRKDAAMTECLLQRALIVYEDNGGQHSADASRTLRDLSDHYAAQGDLARAVLLRRRVHYLTAFRLGDDHPLCAAVLNRLAELYDRMKDPQQAAAARQRAAQMPPAEGKQPTEDQL